jgi:hypothetical protein
MEVLMSPAQPSTDPKRSVTLVVIFSKRDTARIETTHDQAVRAVAHNQRATCVEMPFYGTDTKGNPFTVDVGSATNAVYIEE